MTAPRRHAGSLVALAAAALLAGVLIVALLVLGVAPHTVFMPGHLFKAALARMGIAVPNAAGVITTFVVWWAVIVALWVLIRRGRSM